MLSLLLPVALATTPLPERWLPLSASASRGPELVHRTTTEVVDRREETARIPRTGVLLSGEVIGDALVVQASLQDTCRSREVQTVDIITITEGAGGEKARKQMAWLGVGGLATASLGLLGGVETSGADIEQGVAGAVYAGVFGSLGVAALVRASRMRPQESVETQTRPGPWLERSCPALEPVPVLVTAEARIGRKRLVLGRGKTDESGQLRVPLSAVQGDLDALLTTAPPQTTIKLVYLALDAIEEGPMPEALLAPSAAARAAHAEETAVSLSRQASAEARRGEISEARLLLDEARTWADSERAREALASAGEAIQQGRRKAALRRVRQAEAAALPRCRTTLAALSTFESTVDRLARADVAAAERYIEANRDRVQADMAELGEALEALSGAMNDAVMLGAMSESEQVSLARRIRASCSR